MRAIGQRRGRTEEFDAVIVGASLAGCTTAIKLGRAGARVALVERRPDPLAFKRLCSHFIQASGVPTLERLGLLQAALDAGAVRSRFRIWTRWGWVVPPPDRARVALNLRRERLDPLLRATALNTPGVEPLLGWSAEQLLRDERGRVGGAVVRATSGEELTLRTRLVVGADGRGSKVARLAGVREHRTPHNRFVYGAYFADCPPAGAPDASVWMLDPQWAAAFPTDEGLTLYAAMPTKARLPEFRSDPGRALVAFLRDLPDAPPVDPDRRVGDVLGKLEMPNVRHEPTAPGLALVGDAAMAIDPLWGIGCGWALQSGEWLGDAVGAALAAGPAADRELQAGLRRYRRRWRAALMPHARMIEPLSKARPSTLPERLMFAAGARDPEVALMLDAVGARERSPLRAAVGSAGRVVAVDLRHALSGRPRFGPYRRDDGGDGGDGGAGAGTQERRREPAGVVGA